MDRSEVIERSRSHFLTRDADGFSLWGVDQDGDEPLLTFTGDVAGEERARATFAARSKETARVGRLAVIAVVAGIVYLVSAGVQLVMDLTRGDELAMERYRLASTLNAIEQVAFALLIVTVGWYLVAWLQRRWRREG
jgi:hypothetical protein